MSWREFTLGDVAFQARDSVDPSDDPEETYLGLEHLATDDPTPIGAGRAGETTSDKYRFQPGDIVFARLRPYLRKMAVPDFSGVCSTEFSVLRPADDRVTADFLALLLRRPATWDYAEQVSKGTRMPRASWTDMARMPILVPPLAEQQRIADLVRHMDVAVARSRERVSALAQAVQSVRDSVLSGHELVQMGEVLLRIEGGRSVRGEDRPPRSGQEGIIKVSAVTPLGFIASESKTLPANHELDDHHRVTPGDVLITRSNTPDRVGFTCFVDCLPPTPLYMPDLVFRLVPDTSCIFPRFLAEALSSTPVRRQVMASASGTSQSMQKINKSKIRNYAIPLPRLPEQQRCISILESVDGTRQAASSVAQRLEELRTALIADLLSGEVKLPPSYDRFLSLEAA